MEQHVFDLLIEQNRQTHKLIADLRSDFQTHYQEDKETNMKVVAMGATMRTLKWVVGIGLSFLTLLADWSAVVASMHKIIK